MKRLHSNDTRKLNGGWTRCSICKKNVYGNWWDKYKHCLNHATRCLPWSDIMAIAFGIWC